MSRYKVLITAPWFTKNNLEILRKFFDVTLNDKGRWFTEDELMNIISNYDAVIAGLDPFTARVLDRAGKLRIIARRGIGYDNIDLAKASERGIYVTNTPIPAEVNAVAEFTVALILALTRGIVRSHELMRRDPVIAYRVRDSFLGKELNEMVIGILGLGNIGSRVAEKLRILGAKEILYYDPYVNNPTYRKVNDLIELFSNSDVVTIHTPLTSETKGMVNYEVLSKAKRGIFIVNTARAEIIDRDSLIKALEEGIVAGVALDVFYKEPPDPGDYLLHSEKAIITPHIAAFTEKAFDEIDRICVENVIKVLIRNEEPNYRVI